MASDLFTYLLHYTVARTVYDALFRKEFVVVLFLLVIVCLVVRYSFFRRRL